MTDACLIYEATVTRLSCHLQSSQVLESLVHSQSVRALAVDTLASEQQPAFSPLPR